jgi:outer membrane protein assembly factor BamE
LITRKLTNIIALLTLCGLLSSCSSFGFPGVYRFNIQQGNVISQTMIDKLKPGMSKSQVRFVLGNAVIDDSLNQNRWDYINTVQIGGGDVSVRSLRLYFVEERLSYFDGDFLPSEAVAAMNAN